MKKLLALFSCLMVIFCFTGCKEEKDRDKGENIIEEVKSSTLGGYSKTVEEAFNECFGKENLEWRYEDDVVTVRMPKFDEMAIDEVMENDNNFTVIDLGNTVIPSYRYAHITGWRIEFEYDDEKKEVSDVILKSGFIKFKKNEECESIINMNLLNAEVDSLDKMLLHGIFKENLDVYKDMIESSKEHIKEQKEEEGKMRALLEKLKSKNVSEEAIDEVRRWLVDKYFMTSEKAEKATREEMTELFEKYIDVFSENIESEANKGGWETAARLAATDPY